MTQFSEQPTASIPQACGGWPEIKAAYRFFDNEAVEPRQLLAPHRQATVRRMQGQAVVLAVQDTTSINYATHPATEGLGPITNNRDRTLGLFLHTTLALSVSGEPLGVLAAALAARDPHQYGRSQDSHRRNRTPLREKESQRWLESLSGCQQLAGDCLDTTLVNVADREADIYELFAQALAPTGRRPVHLLIRAQHNRLVQEPQRRLWEFLASRPVAVKHDVKVPRTAGQPARTATLAIRFSRVTLSAPLLKETQPPLTVWAIEASEEATRPGRKSILWRLLTTLPVAEAAAAVEKVIWYSQRWQIEVFHKVLKSGCKIEQRQLQTRTRLQRVLMLDLIVAWRVMHLNQAARRSPQASAGPWLTEPEWQVLWSYMNPDQPLPTTAPLLKQTVRWIGQLGGFIGRKSDGEPGPIVLWRGLQRLHDLTVAWSLPKTVGNG
jgi:hypothetical protein